MAVPCGLVSKLMNAAGVAGLCAVAKALGDAECFNIADDRRSIDEMEADGRMREGLALFGIDHIRGRRQKPAGLALQRQVLRSEPAGRQSGHKAATQSKSLSVTDKRMFHSSGTQALAGPNPELLGN